LKQSLLQHLNSLVTHLFSQGEKDLARTVLDEAENLERGLSLSETGKKKIKFGTRGLLLPAGTDSSLASVDIGEG